MIQSKRFPSINISAFQNSLNVDQLQTLQIFEGQNFGNEDFENLYGLLFKPDKLSVYCGLVGIRKLTGMSDTFDFFEKIDPNEFISFLIKQTAKTQDLYEKYEYLWILSNLSCGNDEIILYLEEKGVLYIFIQALENENEQIKMQGLWGLANIISEKQKLRDCLINIGILKKLRQILRDSSKACQEVLLWTLSNIFKKEPLLDWEFCPEIFQDLFAILAEEKNSNENLVNITSILYKYSSIDLKIL